MEYFRPVDSRSKKALKLDVHLPGMVRLASKSKSPRMIAQHPAHEQAQEPGLIGNIDLEDLKNLDSLSIDFSHAEGENKFL